MAHMHRKGFSVQDLTNYYGIPRNAKIWEYPEYLVSREEYNLLLEQYNALLGTSRGVVFTSYEKINTGWKFIRTSSTGTDTPDTSFATSSYDDAIWRNVTLPYDFSIHQDFNHASTSEGMTAWLDGGDAWYRKTITKDEFFSGKRVFLYFDGVYMESSVYVNGTLVKSNHWYNPFDVEITSYLQDGDNEIAVFARNTQPTLKWYSGSGIIRDVYMLLADDAEVTVSDICVDMPNIRESNGANGFTVANFTIHNTSSEDKRITITGAIKFGEKIISTGTKTITVPEGDTSESIDLYVTSPKLWGEHEGNVYTFTIATACGEKLSNTSVRYGYRWFDFTADGFYLNGTRTEIKGVCLHQDDGCIGAEDNRSSIRRKLTELTKMGCNSIRIPHNPASRTMVEECENFGVTIIEEFFDCWGSGMYKLSNDFGRFFDDHAEDVISTTIKRDINSPAIIMWSIGSEIGECEGVTLTSESEVEAYADSIVNIVKRYDTTRPTTASNSSTSGKFLGINDAVDIPGGSFLSTEDVVSMMQRDTSKPYYCSAVEGAVSTRGEYVEDPVNLIASSYNSECDVYDSMINTSGILGSYRWTGYDFLGGPDAYTEWPVHSSYSGLLDLAGFHKDAYYAYKSWWTTTPMIHITPDTWEKAFDTETGTVDVMIYTNCYKAELYFNGTLIFSKTTDDQTGTAYSVNHRFETEVSFQKGTIVANGYDDNNNLVAQDVIISSQGVPTQVVLHSDRKVVNELDGDIIFVTAELVDINGVVCRDASNRIYLTVEGGLSLGMNNGDPTDADRLADTYSKKAFHGKVMCAVRPTKGENGDIMIKAEADGIEGSIIGVGRGTFNIMVDDIRQQFIDAENPPIYTYDGTIGTVDEVERITLETLTFSNGVNINSSTGETTSMSYAATSDFIRVSSGNTYKITVRNVVPFFNSSLSGYTTPGYNSITMYAYDADQNYLGRIRGLSVCPNGYNNYPLYFDGDIWYDSDGNVRNKTVALSSEESTEVARITDLEDYDITNNIFDNSGTTATSSSSHTYTGEIAYIRIRIQFCGESTNYIELFGSITENISLKRVIVSSGGEIDPTTPTDPDPTTPTDPDPTESTATLSLLNYANISTMAAGESKRVAIVCMAADGYKYGSASGEWVTILNSGYANKGTSITSEQSDENAATMLSEMTELVRNNGNYMFTLSKNSDGTYAIASNDGYYLSGSDTDTGSATWGATAEAISIQEATGTSASSTVVTQNDGALVRITNSSAYPIYSNATPYWRSGQTGGWTLHYIYEITE